MISVKFFITITLFFLCALPVLAIQISSPIKEDGTTIYISEPYQLESINKCSGDVLVKVITTGKYTMVDCSNNGSLWHCACKENRVISLVPISNGVFDVTVQYSSDGSEVGTRTFFHNNLVVGLHRPKKILTKEEVQLQTKDYAVMAIGIIIFLLVIGFFSFLSVRRLFRDEPKDEIEERYSWDRKRKI